MVPLDQSPIGSTGPPDDEGHQEGDAPHSGTSSSVNLGQVFGWWTLFVESSGTPKYGTRLSTLLPYTNPIRKPAGKIAPIIQASKKFDGHCAKHRSHGNRMTISWHHHRNMISFWYLSGWFTIINPSSWLAYEKLPVGIDPPIGTKSEGSIQGFKWWSLDLKG